MKAGSDDRYRVVAVFDRWTFDAVAEYEDEEVRAQAEGRPPPLLGNAIYQDVILGGTFNHVPTSDEITTAVQTAVSLATICDGRAEQREHLVLDQDQWNRLVGERADRIDVAVATATAQGLPAALIAAWFPGRGYMEKEFGVAMAAYSDAFQPVIPIDPSHP